MAADRHAASPHGHPATDFDFSGFAQHAPGYDLLNELHYRYYQFYSNTLVAILFSEAIRLYTVRPGWTDLGILFLVPIFYLGSRDTLRKFYARVGKLLSADEQTPSQAAV